MPGYMLVLDRGSDQIDTTSFCLCTHFGKLYRKNIEEMARNACVCGIALLLLLAVSASAKSNARSESWLAENAKKAGVITLKSGLQYKVLRKGDGDSHPTVDSPCECHYKCGLPALAAVPHWPSTCCLYDVEIRECIFIVVTRLQITESRRV